MQAAARSCSLTSAGTSDGEISSSSSRNVLLCFNPDKEEIVWCVVVIENTTRHVAHPMPTNKATKCPRDVRLLSFLEPCRYVCCSLSDHCCCCCCCHCFALELFIREMETRGCHSDHFVEQNYGRDHPTGRFDSSMMLMMLMLLLMMTFLDQQLLLRLFAIVQTFQ
jgi:hypothetical protein